MTNGINPKFPGKRFKPDPVSNGVKKVILASASKWRKILLERAGVQFTVEVSGHPEDLKQKLSPKKLVQKLALEKAQVVGKRHKDAIIIAADTVAVFRGKAIGKPKSGAEAKKVLTGLSGDRHSLVTGFVILDTKTGRHIVKSEETKVWFRKLTSDEIGAYIKTGEPLTVAGAYAIQGGGSSFASRIEGDFYNIVGLPLASVVVELRRFGVKTGGIQ